MRSLARTVGRYGNLLCRHARLLSWCVLLLGFVVFRWRERLEPWSSDDMDLFQISANAAAGQHWLFGTGMAGPLSHQALRIGLFPVSLPVIALFGANSTSFYLVPLLFALFGFGLVYRIAREYFDPSVALVLAVVHIAWPFELQHASLFLTDLPSAVMGLACLYGIDRAARAPSSEAGPGHGAWPWLAGLAGFESQLLRNNALVLLAPSLLLLIAIPATRRSALRACAIAIFGVLALETLLAYRGLGWGYDYRRVREALGEYSPFLPVYSWREFLVRQFQFQWVKFGKGLPGGLALGLLIAALAGHALLFAFERRPLLLGIAAFGLFSWLVFSFSIYERVPGGVRALAPTNYRYVQAFTYSSLLVWGWLGWLLRQRAERVVGRRGPWLLAIIALPLLLLGFCWAALPHQPARYRGGLTERLVRVLEREAAAAPLRIAGMSYSLAMPRLFCCANAGPVEWRELGPGELADEVAGGGDAFVLRNIPREHSWARYYAPEERAEYLHALKRLEHVLHRDASLKYSDATYQLYVPRAVRRPSAS